MYRTPNTSGGIYSTEDSNEANCSNDSSDTDAQLLESLSQGQKSPCSCTDSHPLFSRNRKNAHFPCPPKKSIIRLTCNLIFLSLITPFCLVKKIYSIISRKANHVLEKKSLEIPFLKEQIVQLQSQLQGLKLGMKDIAYQAVREILEGYTSKGITRWSIEKMLKKLKEKLEEDNVQMPDYALKSAGASIVQARTTRSYRHDGGKYFWMSFVMFPFVKSPDVILQPSYHPGNCWSFPGNQGETVVRLAKDIIPRAVTIEHISKKVSPTGEISSAPKDFAIYGLKEEKEEQGTFLGQYIYDTEGYLIQTFKLKNESSGLMSYIKLKVLNNWGHPNYTCIYRFRVHGDLENI